MPENFGAVVAKIVVDTSSLDQAVERVKTASVQIGRYLSSVDDILSKGSGGNLRAAADLARAQAAIIKATADQTIAQAKLVDAQRKASHEAFMQQIRLEKQALQGTARTEGGMVSDKQVSSVISKADAVIERNRKTTDTEIQKTIDLYNKEVDAFYEAREAEADALARKADAVIANNRKTIAASEAEDAAQEKLAQAAIERADRVLANKRQALDAETAAAKKAAEDQRIAQERSMMGLKARLFAPGGGEANLLADPTRNMLDGFMADLKRAGQPAGIGSTTTGVAGIAVDKNMQDMAAATKSLHEQRQKAIDEAHADAIKMNEAQKRFADAMRTQVRKENTEMVGGTQGAITAASANLAQLENQFKRLQAVAPPDLNIDKLRGELIEAKQPIVDLQAEFAELKTKMDTLGEDPAAIMSFRNQLDQLRDKADQLATGGLDPLRKSITAMDAQVLKATTGWRGFFNQLREGLQELNRQGLGKNIQELGFRLSPAGLAAGVGLRRGIGVAESMEETRLSFTSLTGSIEKTRTLIADLTAEAQRFGLPVVDTLVTFQQYFPILQKTGYEFSTFVDLAARLATVNPVQGVEGGLRAISEAVSGSGSNFISLANRFNIPLKAVHKAIDEANGDTIKGLNNLLNSYSRTTELALQFGNTTRATFTRAKDAVDQFLAQAAQPLLDVIVPIIEAFNSLIATINQANGVIPQLVGVTLTMVAGSVAALFVIGNLVIALEALRKVYTLATSSALGFAAAQAGVAAASAVAGAASSAGAVASSAGGVIGGIGAVAGVISGLLAMLPTVVLIGVAIAAAIVVFKNLESIFDQIAQAGAEAKARALDPIADGLREIARLGDEAKESVVPGKTIGAHQDEFRETNQAIRDNLAQLYDDLRQVSLNKLIEVGPQMNEALRNVMGLNPRGVEMAIGGPNARADLNFDENQKLDRFLERIESASVNTFGNLTQHFLQLTPALQNAIVAVYAGGDAAIQYQEATDAATISTLSINEALRIQYAEQQKNIQAMVAQGRATKAFSDSIHTFANTWEVGPLEEAITALGEAIPDWAEELEEVSKTLAGDVERLKQMKEDREKELRRQSEDRALEAARELFDFIQQRARATEDFWRGIAQSDADFAADRQNKIDNYNDDIQEMEDKAAQDRLDKLEEFNKQIQRMTEDHNTAMERMARDVDQAISARDFLSAQNALQKMQDAEEDFQKELRRRQEDFDEQMDQLEENLEEQRRKKKEDFDKQLKEADEQYARQRQRQIDEFNRRLALEDADRALRLFRQAENYRIEDQRRQEDYQEQVQDIIDHNNLINFLFGKGLKDMADQVTRVFNQIAQVTGAAASTAPGSGSAGFPPLSDEFGNIIPNTAAMFMGPMPVSNGTSQMRVNQFNISVRAPIDARNNDIDEQALSRQLEDKLVDNIARRLEEMS